MSRIFTAGHEALAMRVSNAIRSFATAAESLAAGQLEHVVDVLLVGARESP